MKVRWLATAVLGLLVGFMPADRAFAAEGKWKSDALGWWYQYEDGTYLKNCWQEIKSHWYYFNREGYMVTGWNKIGGLQYHFVDSGELSKYWCYNEKNRKWYYFKESGAPQTGWLLENGNWYWFSNYGEMTADTYRNVNGLYYHFSEDGRMAANRYVGLSYMDENGQPNSRYDIVLEGKRTSVSKKEKAQITHALKGIPSGWIRYFNERGWKLMYYTDKSFFSAPDTEHGVYYVYHKLDTNYKKLKFTNPESLTKAFGEYIGYASGSYDEGNLYGDILRKEKKNVVNYLYIPSIFNDDMKFYFGCLTQAYLGWDTRGNVRDASEITDQTMQEVMNLKEYNP